MQKYRAELVGYLLSFVVVAIVLCQLWTKRPQTLLSRFSCIHSGMKVLEVEKTLGKKPGDYTTRPLLVFDEVRLENARRAFWMKGMERFGLLHYHEWILDNGSILIATDDSHTVVQMTLAVFDNSARSR